jgi:hypothetical protein
MPCIRARFAARSLHRGEARRTGPDGLLRIRHVFYMGQNLASTSGFSCSAPAPRDDADMAKKGDRSATDESWSDGLEGKLNRCPRRTGCKR